MTSATISKKSLWTGRILSTLAVLFFLMDSIMKLWKPVFVVEATEKLGYPASTIVGIGLALLISTLLYVVPRTSLLGAVLITGYLGGAVATQVRVEDWANVPSRSFSPPLLGSDSGCAMRAFASNSRSPQRPDPSNQLEIERKRHHARAHRG